MTAPEPVDICILLSLGLVLWAARRGAVNSQAHAIECHEDSAEVAGEILKLFTEFQLSQNQGWLVLLDLLASTAVSSGLTLQQTQERVAKAFGLYTAAYRARQEKRS